MSSSLDVLQAMISWSSRPQPMQTLSSSRQQLRMQGDSTFGGTNGLGRLIGTILTRCAAGRYVLLAMQEYTFAEHVCSGSARQPRNSSLTKSKLVPQ